MDKKINKKKETIAYLERRKQRLSEQIGGKDKFEKAVGDVINVLRSNNLYNSPTATEDLFEYVCAIISL